MSALAVLLGVLGTNAASAQTDNTTLGYQALKSNIAGSADTAGGFQSAFANTDGVENTTFGAYAAFGCFTTGNNTAVGFQALFGPTGNDNTANGWRALYTGYPVGVSAPPGSENVATGFYALGLTTRGANNVAQGWRSLYSITTGSGNAGFGYDTIFYGFSSGANAGKATNSTAIGALALYQGSEGMNGVGLGYATMYNDPGAGDIAIGSNAGSSSTAGGYVALGAASMGSRGSISYDNAEGWHAMYSGSEGASSAIGAQAMASESGFWNVAVGAGALMTGSSNNEQTVIGSNANASGGQDSVVVGANAGSSSALHNVIIGDNPVAGGTKFIDIGPATAQQTFIAAIGSKVIENLRVYVTPQGALGVVTSSAAFKRDIRDIGATSEALFALRPVSFRYRADSAQTAEFGLIAEEVEKVAPALVVHDAKGQAFSVRYEAVNALLLNQFLQESRVIAAQSAAIDKLRSLNAELRNRLGRLEQGSTARAAAPPPDPPPSAF